MNILHSRLALALSHEYVNPVFSLYFEYKFECVECFEIKDII